MAVGKMTQEQKDYIFNNAEKMTAKELYNSMGHVSFGLGCVQTYMRRKNINYVRKSFPVRTTDTRFVVTYEMEMFLQLYSKEYTISQLKNILEYPNGVKSLHSLLASRKLGCKDGSKSYKYDENYFCNINTPEKAWVLGWIASDGNIYYNKTYSLTIAITDLSVLQNIRKLLGDESVKISTNLNNGFGNKPLYTLRFSSKKMVKDLISLGYCNKKSYKCDYPYWLRADLVRFWIRGYLEGDGTIYTTQLKETHSASINLGFCGTKYVMDGIYKALPTNSKTIPRKCNEKGLHEYRLNGWKALDVLDWIYDKETLFSKDGIPLYLERKYNKYIEGKELYETRKRKFPK